MQKKEPTKKADLIQKEREDKTIEATARISVRAARKCWTPQEARVFSEWDR